MSVTDEIKSRIDIVNYIQQFVPLKKAGRYYKACCPFHAEKTPSFVVNPDTQSWRCFGACSEGGDLFSFAMKQQGWDFREALEQLGQQAGVEVHPQTPEDRQRSDVLDKLRGMLKTAAGIYHEHLLSDKSDDVRATLRYTMEKRGFTLETIKTFGIGYAPAGWQNMVDELQLLGYEVDQIIESGLAIRNDQGRVYDRFRNRLMVPIRDERGRVVGFGARILNPDDNPKYLNSSQSPVFDKSRLLFGLDLAKQSIRESETAVIVEGYMDAIQAYQAGFTNVVAQMGTALTETQLRLIAPRYARKIVLALDADAAGQNATRRSLETARQVLADDLSGKLSIDIRILRIPGAKDPDDFIRESPHQWSGLVERAIPVADFVIDMELAELPADAGVQARETVARRILPLLMATESNLYRQENLQKLALRLKIAERELLRIADEVERTERKRSHNQSRKESPPAPHLPDEPPPLNLDELEPPPFDTSDEVSIDQVNGTAHESDPFVGQSQENLLEAYCLRMMVLHPNAYYAANRRFRELAGDNDRLQAGPLQDLCLQDFVNGNYRSMMNGLLVALKQDDVEIADFLHDYLDQRLAMLLQSLLVSELAGLNNQMGRRFGSDLEDLMKDFDRRIRPAINPVDEFIEKAIALRLNRLNREIHELAFLQQDLRHQQDSTTMAQDVGMQIILARQARQLLDGERKKQHQFL